MLTRLTGFHWAFLSTASASASTLVYLFAIWGKSWSSDFLLLYSTACLMAGLLNTAVQYASSTYNQFRLKSVVLLIYFSAVGLVLALHFTLTGHSSEPALLLFVAGILSPLLFAPRFGRAFANDQLQWVFRENVTLNVFLILAAIAGALLAKTQEQFFFWAGSALLPIFSRWLLSDAPKASRSFSERPGALASILNPALPSLERTLWDQWLLASLSLASLGAWVYLSSRLLTFFGNVVFSYSVGRSMSAGPLPLQAPPWTIKALLGAFSCFTIIGYFIPIVGLVAGIGAAWCASIALSIVSGEGKSRLYLLLLAIWIFELLFRIAAHSYTKNLSDYSRIIAVSSMLLIAASLFIIIKTGKNRQRTEK